MTLLEIFGIALISTSICFRSNCTFAILQEKDVQNPLKLFCNLSGWLLAAVFATLFIIPHLFFAVPWYWVQIIDLLFSLLMIGIIDFRFRIIPNLILIAFLFSQIICMGLLRTSSVSVLNMALTAGLLLILILVSHYSKSQFGMGDAKLLAAINFSYGLVFTVYTTLLALLLMLLWAVPLLLTRRIKLKSFLPFAPFYFLAVVGYLVINFI